MRGKGLVLMGLTAGGALLGFRVVDGHREDARREKVRIVQAIIDEETRGATQSSVKVS
jgi:hypothetical protein